MKNKKLIFIVTCTVVLIAAIISILLFSNNNVDEKYYTISFNTDGGSLIESIKIKENEKITLPSNPTKEGYEFLGWTIIGESYSNEMTITKDITLTAVWSKIETNDPIIPDEPNVPIQNENKPTNNDNKPTNNKPTNNKPANNEPAKKVYVCDDGYTLDGTKCVKTYDAPNRCPDGTYEINGKCLDINVTQKVAQDLNCLTGVKTNIGYYVCKGNRISVDSSSSCSTANGIWFSNEGACYEKGEASYSCPSGYEYLANPSAYNQNIHGESGCYPVKQMRYTCTNSKTDKLEGTKCISTIDAKLQ